MNDQIGTLSGEDFLGFVAIVGSFSTVIFLAAFALIFGFYYQAQKTRRTESLNLLKQDMLGRGMSSYDIATVLAAGTPGMRGRLLRPIGVG